MENRVKLSLLVAAVVVALLIGLILGGSGLVGRLLGGPNPEAIATSSLQSMHAQNRLDVFVARFVSVASARQSKFGFSTERTLILPGDVRYEIDLNKITDRDLDWDGGSKTLNIKIPDIEIAGPDVDLTHAREYGGGGLLNVLTDAGTQLDQANRAKAVADLRNQAQADVPMRMARESARAAVQRSFAMPLAAAGFKDVKVVARFPQEGAGDPPSFIDASTPVNQVLEEDARRRAAEGK
jgi:hypothetical protein